jgi:transcriptional regulator with XRE-family HTH domain
MNDTKFGERIRALRIERGLSQSKLARAAGISQGSLSHVEDGARPLSPATIDRLGAALGINPWELVRGTNAEGKYVASRLSPEEATAQKLSDDSMKRFYLTVLLILYGRFFALYRAVWSHGVCLNDPRHEAMREHLADMCEPLVGVLERYGYADARQQVHLPDAILDPTDTMPECGGESWEYEWEPQLLSAERWIIVELARVGGSLSEEELDQLHLGKVVSAMREWDEIISGISERNKLYMDALIRNARRRFTAAAPEIDRRDAR